MRLHNYEIDIANDQEFKKLFNRYVPLVAKYCKNFLSDTLYDVVIMKDMDYMDTAFFLIRKDGTSQFSSVEEAIDHCDPKLTDGLAVIKVYRSINGQYIICPVYDVSIGHIGELTNA